MESKPDAGSSETFATRGGVWVIVQFILMSGLFIAGPWGESWLSGTLATRSAALALIAVGAWFGIAGVRDLGAQRTPLPKPIPGAQLVQKGVYALVRHPLYASLIWLGAGWALLFCSLPALVVALIQLVFLDMKARREEQWLRETFADYAGYAARVKRFIPRVY